jgi:metallo-beta-lactamase class B
MSRRGATPARDIAAKAGDVLRLGDTTMALYLTPGHTIGTLSPVFDVRLGAQRHRALLWGGTSFNFGRDFGRLDAYIAATQRVSGLVDAQHIQVFLSHSSWDDSIPKMDAIKRQGATAPSPFGVGETKVKRTLTVMNGVPRWRRRDIFRSLDPSTSLATGSRLASGAQYRLVL